jgi:hypothetical protein
VLEEFGLVEAYEGKAEAMLPWLSDADPRWDHLRSNMSEALIGRLQRRSEEDLEMRKRRYDNSGSDSEKS